MNKIVVIGVAVVVMVAAIAAILLLNHPNSNINSNYSSVNTVVTPTTSTTTTTIITTSTSVNTSLNLQMNSLYFINENSSGYYYIFVLNLTSYKGFLQQESVPGNSTISNILIQSKYITPIQIVVKGDYLFVIGYAMSNISLSLGNSYYVSFVTNSGPIYTTQITYEGTWAGSIP
jgi:hypothetical protein